MQTSESAHPLGLARAKSDLDIVRFPAPSSPRCCGLTQNRSTLSQDLLLPLQQSPVVLQQFARLLRLLSVLLNALEQLLILEGVLDKLVLVELSQPVEHTRPAVQAHQPRE